MFVLHVFRRERCRAVAVPILRQMRFVVNVGITTE
jgi:hypothetical protein